MSHHDPLPIPPLGISEGEARQRFHELQERLVPLWKNIESMDDHEPQTIVVAPSLTVEYDIQGAEVQAYEERFLFLLLLLRQPSARLVYITSQTIHPSTIDYYLGLMPGVIASHARKRLFLVAPNDGSPQPLSRKLLQRPRLLQQIRDLIPDPRRAHLVPFNTTQLERDLALRLGIPMYGTDPAHLDFGTKSGCRKLFARCGLSYPLGHEDLRTVPDVVSALSDMLVKRPAMQNAMLKLNEGVSGEGNAVVDLQGLDADSQPGAIEERVRSMQLEAPEMGIPRFLERLEHNGGIVEERISGRDFQSPSVQLRVTPLGKVELLSTHDQLLGGPSGQSYLGCVFPADRGYASLISAEANKVGEVLASEGVIGRFAIDFVVARDDEDQWRSYAIELNLRKGGTTHPFLTLQFLTDGDYCPDEGIYRTARGDAKYFIASDHVESRDYRAFGPDDVFDIAVRHGLHFDQARQTGVVFHMLACLAEYGRLGMTAVHNSPEEAQALYQRTVDVLNREAKQALRPTPL